MALFLAIAVWLLGICSVAPVKAAGETWRGELDQAIELAVAGDLDGSLVILARLEGEHPDEPDIVRRTAQVLARSGKTAKASERFRSSFCCSRWARWSAMRRNGRNFWRPSRRQETGR
jgi:predicted Zn-dependent protease